MPNPLLAGDRVREEVPILPASSASLRCSQTCPSQSTILQFLKKIAKAENKPSSVPFDLARGGTRGDDHQSGMPITRHLKRPTRKSPPARDGGTRRATSPSPARGGIGINPSLFGLALEWGLPIPVLPRERVVSYTTFSPLPLNPTKGGTRRRSFFCGTFRPVRMNPFGPSGYEALCPGELGLSSPASGGGDHLFCFGKSNSFF
jgi:hypothetical protein